MQHFDSLEATHLSGAWLTIGSFDGVHLGHQAIVKQLVQTAHAAGAPAVVLTFFPHPSAILRNRQEAMYLTSPAERAAMLGELGIDAVITQPFTHELAQNSAHEFISRVQRAVQPRHILVGYDFALGRGREGNVERLAELGVEFNYTLDVVPPVQMEGEIVSSSQVRLALAEGEVAKANRLLGRPYHLAGEIVHGDGRGRPLGIPTANLAIWPWRILPRAGVYACRAEVAGESRMAVTNVGVRPTFEDQPVAPRVETHLLDFDHDLYGQPLRLDFIERLRNEQRFADIDALVAQIRHDIAQAKTILS